MEKIPKCTGAVGELQITCSSLKLDYKCIIIFAAAAAAATTTTTITIC
jgi:hypothetical protein